MFSYNLTIKHAVINFHIDKTFLKINQSVILNSGALACAKRAWDRAPYSWNMVNLFSFGCTYIRVYRLYGWGRGDYQKEGRGVSGMS